jgi:hypothetical protein
MLGVTRERWRFGVPRERATSHSRRILALLSASAALACAGLTMVGVGGSSVASGGLRSSWTKPITLSARPGDDVAVVERASGEQIAVWSCTGDMTSSVSSWGVWAAVRPSGAARWGSPQRLSPDRDSYGIVLAANGAGDVVAMWQADWDTAPDGGSVRWALMPSAANHFGVAKRTPEASTGPADTPEVVAIPSGAFLAIWDQATILRKTPTETDETYGRIVAARLDPGEVRWTEPATLPGAGDDGAAPEPVGLVVSPRGAVVAAWDRNDAAGRASEVRVSVAATPEAQHWRTQRLETTLTDPSSSEIGAVLAQGTDGTLALVWQLDDGRVYASVAPPGTRFPPAQRVGALPPFQQASINTLGGAPDVGVGVQPDGRVTLILTRIRSGARRFGSSLVETLPAGAARWTPASAFSLAGDTTGPVTITTTADGVLVALWSHDSHTGWRWASATLSPGSTSWSTVTHIPTLRAVALALEPAAPGAIAVWTTRASVISLDGHFS